ncbi:MAG: glycoside hydrolase family 19 protein [Rhizomicrobium sp.]
MRPIDAALLHEIAQGGEPVIVEALAPELARQLPEAGIDSPLRAAHFLAQAGYETGYLTRLAENLNYSAARIVQVWPRLRSCAQALAGHAEALANAAYAHTNGNGDEASGDGWRYRGRGLFMLTGRRNYALASALGDPDRLETPEDAVSSAIAFWHARDIAAAADCDDIGRVTRLVTGGAEGIAPRTILKHRALGLLAASQS